MREDHIKMAAEKLLDARVNRYQLKRLPGKLTPTNLEDALSIQGKLFDLLGGERVGWFLGGTNGSSIIPIRYAAPILRGSLYESGARFSASEFLSFDVDVEFGFTFGRDLPPRATAYSRSEIFDAVTEVHPTLDIVNSHFTDLEAVGWPTIIADNGTDGVIVRGRGTPLREVSDLASYDVKLIVNGRHVLSGNGSQIMGDPINALCWFVSDMSAKNQEILASEFLATGSCTDIYVAKGGDHVLADFGDLGSVETYYSPKE